MLVFKLEMLKDESNQRINQNNLKRIRFRLKIFIERSTLIRIHFILKESLLSFISYSFYY